jgi:hypothetical protein
VSTSTWQQLLYNDLVKNTPELLAKVQRVWDDPRNPVSTSIIIYQPNLLGVEISSGHPLHLWCTQWRIVFHDVPCIPEYTRVYQSTSLAVSPLSEWLTGKSWVPRASHRSQAPAHPVVSAAHQEPRKIRPLSKLARETAVAQTLQFSLRLETSWYHLRSKHLKASIWSPDLRHAIGTP